MREIPVGPNRFVRVSVTSSGWVFVTAIKTYMCGRRKEESRLKGWDAHTPSARWIARKVQKAIDRHVKEMVAERRASYTVDAVVEAYNLLEAAP